MMDKRPTSLDMIVGMPLKDMNAFYLRDVLYRGGKNKTELSNEALEGGMLLLANRGKGVRVVERR